MPMYTVLVHVKVCGESESDAYRTIRAACKGSKIQEIEHVDSEVIETEPDDEGRDETKCLKTLKSSNP